MQNGRGENGEVVGKKKHERRWRKINERSRLDEALRTY
jgi:hypothetical protein